MSNRKIVEELGRLYEAAEQEEQRLAVLQALGRLGIWATLRLERALYDESPVVRAEAARLLGEIPDWRPTSHLLRMLQYDSAPIARAAAAEALGKLYQPRLPHEKPLGHDDYWAPYHKKEVPAQLVYAMLTDESWRVRAAAASALGFLNQWDAAKHLAKALKDEDHEVRAAAALALGKLRAYPYKGEIEVLLHDQHPQVRDAAVRAVEMIENPIAFIGR